MSLEVYRRGGKRLLDFFIAGLGLVFLAPLLGVIALLVKRQLGTPILFRQERTGAHGEPFVLLKFRTMHDSVGADGTALPDAQRLTEFGKRLRSSSLDELPELWNVFKGDMSVVGPRPLLMEYLPLYSPVQRRRHLVRPGLTGWAQINGRNALSWNEKFAMDVWYVDHVSLRLDLRILMRTLRVALRREGISGSGEATMSRFTGE